MYIHFDTKNEILDLTKFLISMNKLIDKLSLKDELEASATYVNQKNQEEDKNLDEELEK